MKEIIKEAKLLELQIKFEKGLILEEQLSEIEKIELERLYDKQLLELDKEISCKQAELNKKIAMNNEYYKKAIKIKTEKMG